MADFKMFLPMLEQSEGGYQNSESDREGNTNSLNQMVGTAVFGVNAKVYEEYIGHPPTKQEMMAVPKEIAEKIIETKYWDGMVHGNEINSQLIANAIADFTVNAGKAGIQHANDRLWLMGYELNPPATNHQLDAKAIDIFNHMDHVQEGSFVNAYSNDRHHFYDHLTKANEISKHAWENRVNQNFPENKELPGWAEMKEANHYLTTENIQYIIKDDDLHVDGKAGPATQLALQHWQEAHHLNANGFLDESTREALYNAIITEFTNNKGELNKAEDAVRDARSESKELSHSTINDKPEGLHHLHPTGVNQEVKPNDHVNFENTKTELVGPVSFSNMHSSPIHSNEPALTSNHFVNEKGSDAIHFSYTHADHHSNTGVHDHHSNSSAGNQISASHAVSDHGHTGGM